MVDVTDVRRSTTTAEPARGAVPSAWAPLRRTWFRALWTAQFVANTGTWAPTVGAQWLMGDRGGSALQIALVRTAATLPVFVLVIPAGALGDVVDRRRLLLIAQTLMLLSAAALAAATAAHAVTPNRLLILTAVLAVGQALAAPCFQAIQPELVDRDELPPGGPAERRQRQRRPRGRAGGRWAAHRRGRPGSGVRPELRVLPRGARRPVPLAAAAHGAGAGRRTDRAGHSGGDAVRAQRARVRQPPRPVGAVHDLGQWTLGPVAGRRPGPAAPRGQRVRRVAGRRGARRAHRHRRAAAAAGVVGRRPARHGRDAPVRGRGRRRGAAPVPGGRRRRAGARGAELGRGAVDDGRDRATAAADVGARPRAGLLPAGVHGGQALGALAWGAVADAYGLSAAFLIPAGGLVLAALLVLLLVPLRSDADVRHSALPWPEPP